MLVPVRGVSVSVVGPCDRCVSVGTCERCVSVGTCERCVSVGCRAM